MWYGRFNTIFLFKIIQFIIRYARNRKQGFFLQTSVYPSIKQDTYLRKGWRWPEDFWRNKNKIISVIMALSNFFSYTASRPSWLVTLVIGIGRWRIVARGYAGGGRGVARHDVPAFPRQRRRQRAARHLPPWVSSRKKHVRGPMLVFRFTNIKE